MPFVQDTGSTQGGFPSASVSFSVTPTAGNAVFVLGNVYPSFNGPITDVVVTDNQGNVYSVESDQVRAEGDAILFLAHCLNVVASGTFTVTAKGIGAGGDADAAVCLLAMEYAGISSSGALDLTAVATNISGPVTVTTAPDETDTANELVISVYGIVPGPGFTDLGYPAGYTGLYFESPGFGAFGAGAYKEVGSTGVQSVSWPDYSSGADAQAALLQTFRLGGGSPEPIEVTETTSLSAVVQQAITATAAIQAAIQSDGTASTELNAVVQALATAQSGIDAGVQERKTVSAGFDAALSAAKYASSTLNAAVQQAIQANASLQASIQADGQSETSLDSMVQAGSSATASMDAMVQGDRSANATLDAAIQAQRSAATSLQAAVAEIAWAMSSLSAAVAVRSTLNAAMSAAVMAGRLATSSFSAYIYDPNADVVVYAAIPGSRSARTSRLGASTRPPAISTGRRRTS